VAWADYDGDGDCDFYLANHGINKLFRNEMNGTFVDVGAASGTNDPGEARGVAWADYDNDGDLDLYVANIGTNRLYRNEGSGAFTDVGAASGTGDTGHSVGVAWGDYDNDGDFDLYGARWGANRLYRNEGGGNFVNNAVASGTSDQANGTGVAWGDYDNDGWLDLFVANHSSGHYRLFRNKQNGTFTDVRILTGTSPADPFGGQCVAMADYDTDGDLDIYVTSSNNPNQLYRNDDGVPPGHHWLHVDLIGMTSNRSAIGARIRCVAGGLRQIREISGGSGYFTQNSLTEEFGLGPVTSVDTLEVRWPSGVVMSFVDQAVDQRITITEPGAGAAGESPSTAGFDLYPASPNPLKPRTVIHFDVPAQGGRLALHIFDVMGRLVRTLVEGNMPGGRHAIAWNGTDGDGRRVRSGVYFYRLRAVGYERTMKMVKVD
jgi:hypothetical protein